MGHIMNDLYIGIDYGTLSARAVLVSTHDASVVAEATYTYPHGVITGSIPEGRVIPPDYALADPNDYREALMHCLNELMKSVAGEESRVKGIGISATTYTMVPCYSDGSALAEHDENRNTPMAYIKLWKHHGATKQADKIAKLNEKEKCFPAIERYGHCVNCEWALPKLLETYEETPDVYAKADRFCDLGEWLTWMLTGKCVNSLYSAGFKCMWTPEYGFPASEDLDKLAEGFGNAVYEKFTGETYGYEKPCGYVTKEASKLYGIPEGIPVASPMGDGSAPGVFFCIANPDALAITLGTSVAMAFVSDKFRPIPGINGVVKDGIVPGYYSYDAGQPCAGDMLSWFMSNQVPKEYYEAAEKENCSIHDYLGRKATGNCPERNKITVMDWFNGNRSILNDASLRGSVLGLSLETKPEDIYCAMVQGIACGMKVILDFLKENGIDFKKIIVCGGIAEKSEFIRQQYSNILGRELLISSQSRITALSSAMLADIAAGTPMIQSAENMSRGTFLHVLPDEDHTSEYNLIYQRYKRYHDILSSISAD